MKLRPHRSGQDKQLVTFGKIHGIITSKVQASYDNETMIVNLIWASEIVDMMVRHRSAIFLKINMLIKKRVNREVSILDTKRKSIYGRKEEEHWK